MLAWQGNGDRVYARRDLEAPEVAFFYSERDSRYLGAGYLDYFRTAAIARPGAESARVSEVMESIAGHTKMVARAVKTDGGATGRDILTAAAGASLQLMQGEARVPKQVEAKTGTDGERMIQGDAVPDFRRALYAECFTDEDREELFRTFGGV
jgi:hypothetical protein